MSVLGVALYALYSLQSAEPVPIIARQTPFPMVELQEPAGGSAMLFLGGTGSAVITGSKAEGRKTVRISGVQLPIDIGSQTEIAGTVFDLPLSPDAILGRNFLDEYAWVVDTAKREVYGYPRGELWEQVKQDVTERMRKPTEMQLLDGYQLVLPNALDPRQPTSTEILSLMGLTYPDVSFLPSVYHFQLRPVAKPEVVTVMMTYFPGSQSPVTAAALLQKKMIVDTRLRLAVVDADKRSWAEAFAEIYKPPAATVQDVENAIQTVDHPKLSGWVRAAQLRFWAEQK